MVWEAQYLAWGGIKRQTRQTDNPLRYQGQYYDRETGLYYNRHRYYNPECGSFISQDPIGLAGGINLYAYAPNALGHIDPLGLKKGCSIFADNDFLIAASRGEQGALDLIRSKNTYITPNQLHEFLDVTDKAQLAARKTFLSQENIKTFSGEAAREASQSSGFRDVFEAVLGAGHSRGDVALAAFAKATGITAVTAERRLSNYLIYTVPKLEVPIFRYIIRS
ncbi:RHS repeat-associated core domain-containing protein [Kalamiella sp. sgz302252]|uniref:RHS repeat-associated core domain-containing protein n=1 Tax=Pantoea sp. sgz302252 TaxID=3341827 RepID=UPI0036D3BBBD